MECSEGELSDILNPYIPWLYAKAARMQPREGREDLAQEGLIAMWQAVGKFDESRGVPLDFYLKKSATWRMLTVVQKDVYTGQPRRLKKDVPPVVIPVSPLIPPGSFSGDMQMSVLDWLCIFNSDTQNDASFDEMCMSFHHSAIMRALYSTLTSQQRKFAILKFMYGLSYSELVEYFGYSPTTLFRPHHRERLAQALLPLKGLIDGSD